MYQSYASTLDLYPLRASIMHSLKSADCWWGWKGGCGPRAARKWAVSKCHHDCAWTAWPRSSLVRGWDHKCADLSQKAAFNYPTLQWFMICWACFDVAILMGSIISTLWPDSWFFLVTKTCDIKFQTHFKFCFAAYQRIWCYSSPI